MYDFLLGQWILGGIDSVEMLNSFVPRWLTQEQADKIATYKQNGDLSQFSQKK